MNLHPTAELTFRYIETTRDYLVEKHGKCHMHVLATPEFLQNHLHLTPYVSTSKVGDPVVVLNISPMAVREFRQEGIDICFKARYLGVEYEHRVSPHLLFGLTSPADPSILHTCIPTSFIDTGEHMQLTHGIIVEVSDLKPEPEETPARAPFLKLVK